MLRLCPKHGRERWNACKMCMRADGVISHAEASRSIKRPRKTPTRPAANSYSTAVWTEDRVELLKELWTRGASATACALRLGGITRSAVIGKVHRLGLPGRTTVQTARRSFCASPQYRRKPRHALKPDAERVSKTNHRAYIVQDPRPDSTPPLDPIVPPEQRVGIAGLADNQCRWPIGDPQHADFHFCNLNKAEGKSYCELHVRKSTDQPAVRPRLATPANSVRTGLPLYRRESADVENV